MQILFRRPDERRGLEERISEARADLVRAEHDLELAQLLSPIDGIVLERYEQGLKGYTYLSGQS